MPDFGELTCPVCGTEFQVGLDHWSGECPRCENTWWIEEGWHGHESWYNIEWDWT